MLVCTIDSTNYLQLYQERLYRVPPLNDVSLGGFWGTVWNLLSNNKR